MVLIDENREKTMMDLLARITFIWVKYPNLRLCQLIGNCFPAGDNYAKTDEELLERLKEAYPLTKEEEQELEEGIEHVE